MALTREEVEHIAELAKLGLTEEEKRHFQEQLSEVLDYAQRLQELDTDDIPPTAQVITMQNVMREDEARVALAREDVLANAPDAAEGFFRVQAVLE